MVNQAADSISGLDILAGMGNKVNEPILESASRSKEVQYWKKCTGCEYHTEELGWVTTGPVMTPRTAIEFTDFQANKHATPLPQYGHYIVGKVAGQKYDLTDSQRRFQAIIELGGVHEFPLDQMIAYRWDKFPVMRQVQPALNDVKPIPCEYGCVGRTFITPNQLQNHMQVIHKEAVQPDAIGRHFSDAISKIGNTNNGNQLTAESIASIVAAVMSAYESKLPTNKAE